MYLIIILFSYYSSTTKIKYLNILKVSGIIFNRFNLFKINYILLKLSMGTNEWIEFRVFV